MITQLDDQNLVRLGSADPRRVVICDVESFCNYFLIAFELVKTGERFWFEGVNFNRRKLRWVLEHFTVVTFNGHSYDLPMILAALLLSNADESTLFDLTSSLIYGRRPADALEELGLSLHRHGVDLDHVDLINVAFGKASLKLYAGRLHAPYMQDLPYEPGEMLTPKMQAEVFSYCYNDITNTKVLYHKLKPQLDLRVSMGEQYGLDLRSKSDAQIAEAVIGHEMQLLTRRKPERPEVSPGVIFRYKPPPFISYQTPDLQSLLSEIRAADFEVLGDGGVATPAALKTKIRLGRSTYTMGIGGLHSNESRQTFLSDDSVTYIDQDVASYYPSIILNNEYYPRHLGPEFLTVYKAIVDRRLKAKREGDQVTNAALKITINGSFGKFGSKWSILYSPDLMIQVTVTGQLSLLMLIERLEAEDFHVISANTDGLITEVPVARRARYDEICKAWVELTGFVLEPNEYAALYSRDVSNYIGVSKGGKVKLKGCYRPAEISKNPAGDIIYEAVAAQLTKGIPVATTIRSCSDVRKFVFVRQVKGGALKEGEYLGKVIRWYHARGDYTSLKYRGSGNNVPKSGAGKPIMELPDELPADLDHDFYIREAEKILREDFINPAARQLSLF